MVKFYQGLRGDALVCARCISRIPTPKKNPAPPHQPLASSFSFVRKGRGRRERIEGADGGKAARIGLNFRLPTPLPSISDSSSYTISTLVKTQQTIPIVTRMVEMSARALATSSF